MSTAGEENGITLRRWSATWWPLAISWMLMAAEPPMLAAVVARLANPHIHLAAYGSVTFPLIGILQAPILTLLSLSTTMSRDWDSFRKGRKIMLFLGGGLTLLYAVIAFTPLYDVVVRDLDRRAAGSDRTGAPGDVRRAAVVLRGGLPAFSSGVLIRFEHSRAVTVGTLLRFTVDALVLVLGFLIGSIPGTVLATGMMVCGVVTDAVYVGLRVRPVMRVRTAPGAARRTAHWVEANDPVFHPSGHHPIAQHVDPSHWERGPFAATQPTEDIGHLAGDLELVLLDRHTRRGLARSGDRHAGPARRQGALLRFIGIVMAGNRFSMMLVGFTPLAYRWFTSLRFDRKWRSGGGSCFSESSSRRQSDQPSEQLVRRIDPAQPQVAPSDRRHDHLPCSVRGGAAGRRGIAQCERVVHRGDGFGDGQHDANGLVVVPQPGSEERDLRIRVYGREAPVYSYSWRFNLLVQGSPGSDRSPSLHCG